MIKAGNSITLLPYKTYKNNPSKNEPVGYGTNDLGDYLKFQVLDVNKGYGDKCYTGFMYVNVYTDLPLKVHDRVTIESIVSIQRKYNIVAIWITIKEKSPSLFEEKNMYADEEKLGIDF